MSRRRQRGAALIAMMAVLALGASWWLVSALSTPVNRGAHERAHNARVLNEAKQALLGWIASQALTDDHPGRMPCPEHPWHVGNPDKEGMQGPPVGVANPGWGSPFTSGTCAADDTLPTGVAVGRFPWRSVGIDRPFDAAGEPLWFITSIDTGGWAYRSSSTVLSINSNKAGGMRIDGVANAAVAAIIAPGRPLNINPTAGQASAGCPVRTQRRATAGGKPAGYLDYIECHDLATTAIVTKVSGNATNEVFNDQVVYITAAEVMAAIEPVVTARIKSTIVPQIQSIYASAAWGASAANPVFPFASSYPAAGAFDASAATYKGSVDEKEGLLPVSAATCSSITNGRCDNAFVRWKTSSISVAQTGGSDADTWTSNCAASSTAAEIVCTITYGKALCVSAAVGACTVSGGSVNITARALNVGMAMRTQTTAPVSGLSPVSMSAPFITAMADADRGGVTASVQGTLPTVTGCTMNVNVFGVYVCAGLLGVTTTQTIRIPIGVFADHPFLAPTTASNWYWFFNNSWHHVTYYAVSPDHVPTGARNCTASGNCLNVTAQVGGSLTNKRVVLALAGRSVNGTVGPSRAFIDFLDVAENRDRDTAFEQNRFSKTFNDRFVAVSP